MNTNEAEILLVEDDPGDAELTARSLRKEGLLNKIVVARDGAEALDLLFASAAETEKGAISRLRLVLLDLQLPHLSGHAVLRQSRRTRGREVFR